MTRARGFAEPIKAGLAKTDEQHTVMERALSDAQRFDPSEGRWRGVTDKYVKGADANQARLETIYRDLRTFQADCETALKDNEALTAVDKSLLAPLREMIAAVAALRDKDRSKLFGMLASDRQAFVNASDEVLKGQSNPRVAASNKYGRAKHRELQRDSKFACAEVEFAAGGGFADCVSHAQCTVWEFKPSSWSESDAIDQASRYVPDVDKAFPKETSAGKPWEKCWQSSGPTGGDGFKAKGYLYQKCE
ncbi:MAG: hypothetical protein R3B06_14865 [Kofleriaceae bacterium]